MYSIEKMYRTLLIVTILCFTIFQSCKNETVEIFVSQAGQADNAGTKEAPFSEINDAIEKAYQIKQKDSKAEIVINVLSGDYYLSSPIVINSALNGLKISGSRNSEVTVKGSAPLNLSWEKTESKILVANVTADIDFDQFIVNNKLQILARYPNYNDNGGYWQGYAADAISPDRIKNWENPEGAIFNAMHSGKWGGFHYEIAGIDSDGEAILEGGFQNNRPSRPHPEYRMVENVLEELDSPGEWFLDKVNHKIYYWPTSNVDLSAAKYEGVCNSLE